MSRSPVGIVTAIDHRTITRVLLVRASILMTILLVAPLFSASAERVDEEER